MATEKDALTASIKVAFMAGWNACLSSRNRTSLDGLIEFEAWQHPHQSKHRCRCAACDHVWRTKKYPSPCPQCRGIWT